MQELVSIIMPSYNTGKYIAESLQSVLNQTYENWELLIVDDHSTDDTDVVIGLFHDERIRYIKNERNLGAAVSRNVALRLAKGRWIAFLDSDDLWVPEKLEKQINYMLERNCAFSYSIYEEIDESSNSLDIYVSGPKRITKIGMFNYCWPGCLTVIYDANKIGLIQIKDIKKNNDYAMWLKVCEKADCYFFPECLAKYRRRNGSISRNSIKTLVGWHYKLYHEALEMNSIISIVNTGRNLVFGLYKKFAYVDRLYSERK